MTKFAADRFVYVFNPTNALTSGGGLTMVVYSDPAATIPATITTLAAVPIPFSRLTVGPDSLLPEFLDTSNNLVLYTRALGGTAISTIEAVIADVVTRQVAVSSAGIVAAGLASKADAAATTAALALKADAAATTTALGTKADSVATTAALALKADAAATTTAMTLVAPISSPTFTGTVSGVTKAMVGLPLVDNTTDLSKPISTAQASALALKADGAATTASLGLKADGAATATALGLKADAASTSASLALLAPLASPAFTGAPTGLTKTMVGLANVDNTTDVSKPVSTAQATALGLKADAASTAASLALLAPLASPAFTGTPTGLTKTMVGLSNVDNTSDLAKPVSTAVNTALGLKADAASTATSLAAKADTTDPRLSDARVPVAHTQASATITDFAASVDIRVAAGVTGKIDAAVVASTYAPLASPAFTGTPTGLSKASVGLANVDNTTDAAKPISTATAASLALLAPLASPAFTGTPTGLSKASVGLANVDNTTDVSKPVSTATTTALGLKADAASTSASLALLAPLSSPAFTGTPTGLTKVHVGLANVDNTADLSKPVSTAQAAADALRAPLASPTFTGTVAGITKAMVGLANVDNTADTAKPVSTAVTTALGLKLDATAAATAYVPNWQPLTTYAINAIVVSPTGELVTAIAGFTTTSTYTPSNWTHPLLATATAATTYAPIASPTFTGTVAGITKTMVGLASVDNTTDVSKPVSTAVTTALGLKLDTSLAASTYAPVSSPTFTGTVSGVTKAMVGLGSVDNTTDAAKPISTAAATALAAKADLITGTVPTSQIPAVALTNVVVVASQAAMLALTTVQVQPGDVAVRTDGTGTFMLSATDPSILGNWILLNAPTDKITSVNSQIGTVILGYADVGADAAGAAAAAQTAAINSSNAAIAAIPAAPLTGTFMAAGILAVKAGASRLYNNSGRTLTLAAVTASVNTAPTGAALIVDVLKGGVTIFTTQANRPTIAVSTFTVTSPVPAVTAWGMGEYLTVTVSQIGSTVAGSDLTVQVIGR